MESDHEVGKGELTELPIRALTASEKLLAGIEHGYSIPARQQWQASSVDCDRITVSLSLGSSRENGRLIRVNTGKWSDSTFERPADSHGQVRHMKSSDCKPPKIMIAQTHICGTEAAHRKGLNPRLRCAS